jgi:hypothetical protein
VAVLKISGRIPERRCGLSFLVSWLWLVVLADTGNVFCPPASAQELATPEYKVKAAFLYNFATLTEWPSNTFTNTTEPFVIGVLGRDPFGSSLDTIFRGKTLEGRPISIVRFSGVREVHGCHLLFIPASEEARLPSILSHLSSQPVLTVGDSAHFAWRGGIIGLVNHGEEIHFEINLEAAKKARLKLSSKLLRLAETVLPPNKEKHP